MSTGKLARRYNPLRLLGEGAMGQVWLVEDTVSQSEVALKVIAEGACASEASVLQMKQEFRLMTRLRHPHCCAVYDYGQMADGAPYFTMEVVPGAGLDELLPLSDEQFQSVLRQLLLALGYVHQQGLVHRDLKPANVRLQPDGTVKLMDFGLMEHAGRAGGAITGTVAYLAPEVVQRGRVDLRSDLYSLGALAYELLTGRPPFLADKPVEVLRAHVLQAPEAPGRLRPGLDPALERLVLKLLAKEPIDRYQSAGEVLAELGLAGAADGAAMLLTSPMTGREAELAELSGRLAAVAAGRPGGAVVIHGAQGLGKSRLIEALRFDVQLANLPIAVAVNHEFAGSPYGPVAAALRGLMPAIKAHARDVLNRVAPVLVAILPELAVDPAEELDAPSKEKVRLQGAIAELLGALADRQGLVVAVENCQWADPLSAELLPAMLRHLSGRPALVVLSMRELPEAASWRELVTPMPLGPLSPDALCRMVSSMLGAAEPDPALLARVAELSAGNPFFVEALLQHLVAQGALGREGGHWRLGAEIEAERLPRDLRGLLEDQLARLGPEARTVAKVAAAVGYAFDLDLLKRVTGLEDEALFAAVAALEQHRLFAEREPGAYAFSQDPVQDMLYSGLTAEDRLQLHTAIAGALEARLAGRRLAEARLEEVAALADQAMRGTRRALAVAACLEAGVRHAALMAHAAGIRYLESGLASLRALGGAGPDAERLAYLQAIGDARRMTGQFAPALAAYEEALPLAEGARAPARLAGMLTSLAKIHQVQGRYGDALAVCERARALAEGASDRAEAARSLLTSARVHYFLGDIDAAVAHTERALDAARAAEDTGKTGMALGFLGYLYATAVPARIDEGVAMLLEAVALADALGDRIGLNSALDFLGNAQIMLGEGEEARANFERKLAICREIGYREEEAFTLVNLAIAASELGDHGAAARLAGEASALAEALMSRFPLGMAQAIEGVARLHLGEAAIASSRCAAAAATALEAGNKLLTTQVRLFEAERLLAIGDVAAASEAAEALAALVGEASVSEAGHRLRVIQAEVALRQGRAEEARDGAMAAAAAAQAGNARGLAAQARLVAGRAAIAAGDWDAARSLAAEALAAAEPLGQRARLAIACGLLGEVALAEGKPEEARDHFGRMREAAEACGAPVPLALAAFGLAAAAPYDAGARALADEARRRLEAVACTLPEAGRSAFLALPERRRVIEGNHIGFGLPVAKPREGPPMGRIGWQGF